MLALLAALFLTSDYFYNAAFSLRPSALRGTSGGATMTTPGGASTLPPLENILELLQSVLGTPASIIGSELPWLQGSGPSLFLPRSDKPCSYQDGQGRGILRGVLPAPLLRGAR